MPNPNIELFIKKVEAQAEADANICGVAVAGSAITGETDEYSDLDLVIVTASPVAPEREKMRAFAARFPGLIAEFTGDHVGEPRLLICLYENPLLHVDFKFLLPHELGHRVEDPLVLFERGNILTEAFAASKAEWPMPDLQWIEDRFWTWVHYTAVKIGRGELFEAADSLSFIRARVLGPLLHMQYGRLPRGVRKLEQFLKAEDLSALKATQAEFDATALAHATFAAADLYRRLRPEQNASRAEQAAIGYLEKIKNAALPPRPGG